ncbi:class I lanthipeptide [Chitinophaga varians]|uniref:class I lanthipeptide n=1 Tax=Chitinophaga varians TaxID=2202339 RepID=UPI001B3B283F
MKKKHIDIQRKISLNKVTLVHLNLEHQGAVLSETASSECINTRWCNTRSPYCISIPWPTIACG